MRTLRHVMRSIRENGGSRSTLWRAKMTRSRTLRVTWYPVSVRVKKRCSRSSDSCRWRWSKCVERPAPCQGVLFRRPDAKICDL